MKPQVNALALNDLDRDLSDEMLNQMEVEDAIQEDLGQLSLNAFTSKDTSQAQQK